MWSKSFVVEKVWYFFKKIGGSILGCIALFSRQILNTHTHTTTTHTHTHTHTHTRPKDVCTNTFDFPSFRKVAQRVKISLIWGSSSSQKVRSLNIGSSIPGCTALFFREIFDSPPSKRFHMENFYCPVRLSAWLWKLEFGTKNWNPKTVELLLHVLRHNSGRYVILV